MIDFLEYLGLILTALMLSAVTKGCVDKCIEEDQQIQQQIHDCYIQESKTKECEYILWKEENKNQDDDFVTGMLLGQAMSGGLQ